MPSRLLSVIATVAVVGAIAQAADTPALRLPHVFSDHAVLQRDRPLPVWGWAAPEAEVVVTLAGQEKRTKAGADGAWKVTFDALAAGPQARELRVVSGADQAVVADLLVGEVWVCSGQSNMEWGVWGALNHEQEIAAGDHPRIRLLTVAKASVGEAASDVAGSWAVCTPQTVGGFSAVGYFFGRELTRVLDVPVGLINTSWGGTPAESWASRDALAADAENAHFAKRIDDTMANLPALQAKHQADLAEWERKQAEATAPVSDAGWEAATLDESAWEAQDLPGHWEQSGLNIDGVVWYRRTVTVPAAGAGKDLALSLGTIDDADVTWWDGVKVGETQAWNLARAYTVPAAQATAGDHVIAIRVTDTGGPGGVYGKAETMSLSAAGSPAIPLAGSWKRRVGAATIAKPGAPDGPGNPWFPSSLRNGMITPLVPYAIRGAIWYQGESNAGRAWQYRTLFPTMISDWRAAWGQGDFPFLFVQLANFMQPPAQPGDSAWAELRDAQTHTLTALPETGMAVAIDIGQADDIHPRNKQDVGLRLAKWALATTYKVPGAVASGPLYREATIEDGAIRISFDHLGGGLVAKGGTLDQFAIAGEDKQWVWAEAAIDGETVVVRSATVPKPLAVRYAWSDNPEGCNLSNQAGLPASPFRTDDWPAITLGAR